MSPGFVEDGRSDKCIQVFVRYALSKWCPKVCLGIAQKAEPKVSVSSQAHPVATSTKWLGHRTYKAKGSFASRQAEYPGFPIQFTPVHGLQGSEVLAQSFLENGLIYLE